MTSQEIKKLRSRLNQLANEKRQLDEKQRTLMVTLFNIEQEISTLEKKVEKYTKNGRFNMVTDHAIVRYLERVEGMDIHSIKEKILGGIESTLVDGDYPLSTHRIIIKDAHVVTVIGRDA